MKRSPPGASATSARGRRPSPAAPSRPRRAGARAPTRPRPAGASPARPAAAGSGRRAGRGSAPPCRPRARRRARTARPRRRRACRRAGRAPRARTGTTCRRRAAAPRRAFASFVVGAVDELRPRTASPRRSHFFRPLNSKPCLERRVLDVLEELVDRLVAERGDADALARPHQRDRHPRAVPRLARAGRALDEEVAAVEATAPPRPSVPSSRARGGRRSRISTSAG